MESAWMDGRKSDMKELSGKVTLITGAGSGIGRATAMTFARNGARVIVADIDGEGGGKTVKMAEETSAQALFIPVDVSKADQVKEMVKIAVETFGGLDVLVNCAGIIAKVRALMADYPLEMWERTMAINVSGTFYAMKYAIPAIVESGGGAIVNLSSVLGSAGDANRTAYVASKHAVVGLTKVAALGYARKGVRVNAIGPGMTETPLIEDLLKDKEAKWFMLAMHPIGRFATAEEIANLILFLCSDKSSFMTGAYYPIDGGYLAQ